MVRSPYEEAMPGFKACVPSAFSDAVGACTFVAGDVLYNSEAGYSLWDEAVKKLRWSIQVSEGAKVSSGSEEKTQGTASFLFDKNWFSSVTLRVTKYPSLEVQIIVSTQGKLYTVLWKGDLSVLTQESDPPVPITVAKTIEFLPRAKSLLDHDSSHLVSWVMASDRTNQVSVLKLTRIRDCLRETGQEATENFIHGSSVSPDIAPTVEFVRLSMDSTKVEAFRDAVIEALWPARSTGGARKTVRGIYEKKQGTTASRFSLDDHGIFSPDPRGLDAHKDVWVRCFTHKTYYRYRFARQHARALNVPKSLTKYLESIFAATPNFLFADGVSLCASQKAEAVSIKVEQLPTHNLMTNAALSEGLNLAKQRHECLQKYLIENERQTLATEIPVWVEANEFDDYVKVFGSSLPMTGHIDILHVEEDGRIGIWDYKPNSAYETKAFNQLRLYAFMLATRTGLPASAFLCGYFDERYCFAFKPEEHPLG